MRPNAQKIGTVVLEGYFSLSCTQTQCYTQDYPQKMGTTQSSGKRDDALSMPGAELKGQDEPTLLEVVLQVQGDS